MSAGRAVRVALVLAAAASVDVASAQRTRFPGDSPTRTALMGGRPLGTPSGVRPTVPTFTIPQPGFSCGWPWAGRVYPFPPASYWYDGVYYGSWPWLPPVYVNAGYWYGPRAVTTFAVEPRAPVVVEAQPPADPLQRLPEAPAIAGRAGSAALKRAWRYIDYGDRHFREGRPRDAYSRYRKAIEAAPDLADAHFRRGFAELAMGNIERSATAIRRGLQLDPDWPRSGFDLGVVFDPPALDAAARVLSRRVQELPNDADARLLAGVVLHFNGELEAAQAQFLRVMKLTGGSDAARAFLPVQPEAQEAAALLR